jgi:hypothetical protein
MSILVKHPALYLHCHPHIIYTFSVLNIQVLTNWTGVYNTTTGRFTANMVGVYHFAVTVMAGGSGSVHVALTTDSGDLCLTYAKAPYNSGTCVANVALQNGDNVWVKHVYSTAIDAIEGLNFPTFSGYFLWL